MGPDLIVQLVLGLAAMGAEAWENHQATRLTIAAMLAENRGPTEEELTLLREAGLAVDEQLDELLAD